MGDRAKPARVGILGGMGPAATADFYRKLVEATPAERDQDHIPVLVEADPAIPDRSESYLRGGPTPLPFLQRGAKLLEARGADLLVMPCNTAHLWYEAIVQQLGIPLLHIVDAVVEDLLAQLGGAVAGRALRVGLLGTEATARGRLYPLRAIQDHRARAWQWVLPGSEVQARLQQGIAAVKGGDLDAGRRAMADTCDGLLGQRVDAIVYACTEVPLALAGGFDPRVAASDSTAALARYTVRRAASSAAAASFTHSTK